MTRLLRGLAACLALAELVGAERGEAAADATSLALELTPGGQLSRPRRRGHSPTGSEASERWGVQHKTESALEIAGSSETRDVRSKQAIRPLLDWLMGKNKSEEDASKEHAPPKENVRLMTYNVYYENRNYTDIAELIKTKADPDIVAFQEAILDTSNGIVNALNARRDGEWKLANPWNERWYWTGLVAYRSDKWQAEWRTEIPVPQNNDSRGVCGVRLRRKEDGLKYCVFSAHPLYESGGPSKWAAEAIQKASDQMKACQSEGDAPVIFMCDCNTMDHKAVTAALSQHTGFGFELAYSEWFDQIHVEQKPKKVGHAHGGWTIGRDAGKRYCKADCRNEAWAWSDHPVPVVDISPE